MKIVCSFSMFLRWKIMLFLIFWYFLCCYSLRMDFLIFLHRNIYWRKKWMFAWCSRIFISYSCWFKHIIIIIVLTKIKNNPFMLHFLNVIFICIDVILFTVSNISYILMINSTLIILVHMIILLSNHCFFMYYLCCWLQIGIL